MCSKALATCAFQPLAISLPRHATISLVYPCPLSYYDFLLHLPISS
jgi:hypothetical protein